MVGFAASVLLGVVQLYLVFVFAGIFMGKRPAGTLYWLGVVGGCSLAMGVVNILSIPLLNIVASSFFAVLMVGLLFKGKLQYVVLSGIGGMGIQILCEYIVYIVADFALGMPDRTVAVAFTQLSLILTTLNFLLSFTLMRIIKLVAQVVKSKGKDILLASNFATVLLPVVNILNGYYIIYSSQFSHNSSEMAFAVVLFALLLLTSVLVLFANENDRKKVQLQTENDAMHFQEKMLTSLIERQEQHLEEVRLQGHEFKNHLICIQQLVRDQGQANSDADSYIQTVFSDLEQTVAPPNIRNKALLAMVLYTQQKARASNIAFTYHLPYDDFSFLTMTEAGTLFGNLLNNALEACMKLETGRSIRLSIQQVAGMVCIECKNSFNGHVVEKNGNFVSTKEDAVAHGIGLRNIRRIVQEHGGYCNTKYNAQWFTIYVDLPLP